MLRTDIRGLFLDIGGVLLTDGWGEDSRRLAALMFGLDYDEMEERHDLAFGTYEEGRLTMAEYLDWVVFHRERAFSREEFKAFMLSRSKPYAEMISLARQLKARYDLKVGVVSNSGREFVNHRIQEFGLRPFVDFFISSSFVHLRKPDPRIYRLALDLAQLPAHQVAYVEDRRMFVEVAREMGIIGIEHTDYGSTRVALEKLGLSLSGELAEAR